MNANVSSRINLMRILLISGIVFVHVPYDPANSPFTGANGLIDWVRVFLGDSLFRVGVPCLSAISGYLLFRRGLDGFSYGTMLRSKARTVLVPFLLWNGAFLVLVWLAQKNGIGAGYLPDVVGATPREVATLAFAAEGWPINLPLYFLRDLLLCLLLSPVLGYLLMHHPRATLLAFLAYAVLPVPNGLFLKKSILFGFGVGIAVALHRIDLKAVDRHAGAIVLAVLSAALLLSVGLYVTGPEFPVWLDALRSATALSGIVGAWALSAFLVQTRLGGRLATGGGLSFWIFCAHYPLLVALWMAWNRLGTENYPLFYFAAPLLAFAILIPSHALVRQGLPTLHALLTGNRARRGNAMGSPASGAVPSAQPAGCSASSQR
ncbi:acyltransferase family protein [Mycoplana dimorpha]|uniref:Succinoglycan biosynthesis protein ExoH n=1 Tax=Mycoplana dimorpha TaxID=28320 RepID=A0A2T5BDT3_MYCDI|nr:acyltransferase [Mycoplana dimorpha]PTM97149.1 succinoglycan biosynthesis protein ExoH [Mycoplana dimorpha]